MSVISNISSFFGIASIQFIPGTEYTAIYTYSLTNDFGYTAEHPDAGVVTKTITWTVKSSMPIQGGTFIDGTPWVADNGDIRLYSVNPSATSYQARGITMYSSGTYFFDANNTVINPDFGKVVYQKINVNSANSVIYDLPASTGFFLKTSSGTDADTVNGRIYPLDGRGGKVNDADLLTTNPQVGDSYDSTQKWSGSETKLNTGDMVMTAISHNTGMTLAGISYYHGVDRIGSTDRLPIIDMYGVLTCIGSTFATIASSSFRPPVNWDPADRANAPILQEVDDCSSYLFSYPNYDYDGEKSWSDSQTLKSLFNGDVKYRKYGSPTILHAANNQSVVFGHAISRGDGDIEYGDDLKAIVEVQIINAFDSGLTAEVRNLLRRVIAQRGIDIYGAYRSCGKSILAAGGLGSNYYAYMPLAYLCTRYADIYNILNMTNVGNTANGTFLNFENCFYNPVFFHGQLAQNWKYPESIAQTNFIHAGRWQGLEIAGISSGATYQKIFVKPPTNTPLGTVITNINGTTFIHGWTSSSLYNKSHQTTRWNMRNSAGTVNNDSFMGGYVQNESRGATFISRVIKSTGSSTYPNSGWTETLDNFATNAIHVLYLRSDIFAGGETYCNLSPYVKEDIDNGNTFIVTDSGGTSQWWSAYPYGQLGNYSYASVANIIPYAIFYHGVSAAGIPMPRYIDESYKTQKNYLDNKWGRLAAKLSVNATYQFGNQTDSYSKSYDALARMYYLNGVTGFTTGTAINESVFTRYSNGTRSEFPPDQTNWTWLGFSAAPNNITIVGDTINFGNNPTSFYIAGATAKLGDLRNFQYRSTTGGTFAIYFLNNTTNQISYNTYLKNKQLYIWFGGASKPIGLTLGAGSTAPSDTSYTQYWVLPDGKNNLHDLIPRFINTYPYRLFFADPY